MVFTYSKWMLTLTLLQDELQGCASTSSARCCVLSLCCSAASTGPRKSRESFRAWGGYLLSPGNNPGFKRRNRHVWVQRAFFILFFSSPTNSVSSSWHHDFWRLPPGRQALRTKPHPSLSFGPHPRAHGCASCTQAHTDKTQFYRK